jgi:hypothetical protein
MPKLTGVMPDGTGGGVAVLSDSKGAYVVEKGSSFGGGYKVTHVDSAGVTLTLGKATIILPISK